MRSIGTVLLFVGVFGAPSARAQAGGGAPWDSVGRVLGARVAESGGVYRYNFPRSDLTVRVGDVTVEPGLALGSWAGFAAMGSDTVVMGDLVVTASELGGVLRQLSDDGLAVTAVHNHLVGEEPRIMYVHYEGRGGALALAQKVDRALARTGAPRPVRVSEPRPVAIDTALVFRELGARGRAAGRLVQLGFNLVPRPVTMHGHAVPAALALGTPVNLQLVDGNRVVATGDFTVTAEQLDPVLDALARHGIVATAVHSHLVGESPTLYYMHFWADGPLPEVLRGLRAALDAAR